MGESLIPLLRADGGAVFFIVLMFFIVGGVIVLAVVSEQKARERWRQFAAMYGFSCQVGAGGNHMSGWFDGVYVHIGTVVRGSGKHRHTYTQFSAMIQAPVPYGITVYQETIFSKVGKFFGGDDIQVGDQQLDEAFIIKGSDAYAVQAFVRNPIIRDALFRLLSVHSNFVLDQGRVLIELNGRVSDQARMYSTTLAAVQMVQAINAATGVAAPAAMPVAQAPKAAPVELPVGGASRPGGSAPPAPARAATQAPSGGPVPKRQPPANMPRPDNTPRGAGGDLALFDKLGDPTTPSSERDGLIEQLKGKPLSLPVVVDRIDMTSSFDVPEALKDGHTAIGTVNGLRAKVAVRFPKARDAEVRNMKRGEQFHVLGKVVGYDSLFDRVNVDA